MGFHPGAYFLCSAITMRTHPASLLEDERLVEQSKLITAPQPRLVHSQPTSGDRRPTETYRAIQQNPA